MNFDQLRQVCLFCKMLGIKTVGELQEFKKSNKLTNLSMIIELYKLCVKQSNGNFR